MKKDNRCQLSWCFLAFLFISNVSMVIRAQDDPTNTPPPGHPYISSLKGNFTFVKKITYKPKPATSKPEDAQEAAPAPAPITELDSVQTGALRKDKQVFADGTNSEIWRSGPLRFIISSAHPDGFIVASKTLNFYVDPTDFTEVEWVGPSSFQGEQNLDTRKCYVYKQGTQMAWIDKSTLLPIQYDSDLMHVTYTYGVPDYPLQLPANCLKKEQQMRRSWSGQPN
jgi:hypothetical protein